MKKMSYFVAALLAISAASATLTSCIDNNEPEGISTLRNAKAGLLNAMAQLKLADAEVQKANAAYKNALAQGELLKNESTKLANDLQAAKNELVKDSIQAKMEQLAESHKANMAAAKQSTAEAEENLRVALAKIEAEKLVLTKDQDSIITAAQDTLKSALTALNSAQNEINAKENLLYQAMKGTLLVKDSLELQLARAEVAVLEKSEDLAVKQDLLAAMGNDDALKEEFNKLNKEVLMLEDSIKMAGIELAKVYDSAEYKALSHRISEIGTDTIGGNVATGLFLAEYNKAKTTEKIEVKLSDLTKATLNTLSDYKKDAGTLYSDLIQKNLITGVYEGNFTDYKKALNTLFTSEYIALYNEIAAGGTTAVANAQKLYDAAVKNWTKFKTLNEKFDKDAIPNAKAALYNADKNTGALATAFASVNDYNILIKAEEDKKEKKDPNAIATYQTKQNALYTDMATAITTYWDTIAKANADVTFGSEAADKITVAESAQYAGSAYVKDGSVAYKAVTKTLKEWLKDDPAYLIKNIWGITDAATLYAKVTASIGTSVVIVEYSQTNCASKAKEYSEQAFGTYFKTKSGLEGKETDYMRVVPTDAEVIAALYDFSNYDAEGKEIVSTGYIGALQKAKNTENSGMAKNYKAIQADLQAAQKSYEEAIAKVIESQNTIEANIKALTEELDAKTKAKDALTTAVNDNTKHLNNKKSNIEEALGLVAKKDSDGTWKMKATSYNTMKQAVKTAEDDLLAAQKTVEEWKLTIQQFEDGKLTQQTLIDQAQRNLDAAQVAYEIALINYKKAATNLTAVTAALVGIDEE